MRERLNQCCHRPIGTHLTTCEYHAVHNDKPEEPLAVKGDSDLDDRTTLAIRILENHGVIAVRADIFAGVLAVPVPNWEAAEYEILRLRQAEDEASDLRRRIASLEATVADLTAALEAARRPADDVLEGALCRWVGHLYPGEADYIKARPGHVWTWLRAFAVAREGDKR